MAKDANWAGPERAAHNKKKWRRPKAPALTLWLVCVLIFPGELGGGERAWPLKMLICTVVGMLLGMFVLFIFSRRMQTLFLLAQQGLESGLKLETNGSIAHLGVDPCVKLPFVFFTGTSGAKLVKPFPNRGLLQSRCV